MPKVFNLLFSVCLYVNAGAQEGKREAYAIAAGPVILSPGLIGMQAGVELSTNGKIKWLPEFAIPLFNPDRFRQTFKSSVFRAGLEARFQPGNYSNYIGIQAGYIHRKFNDRDSGYFVTDPKKKNGFLTKMHRSVPRYSLQFSKLEQWNTWVPGFMQMPLSVWEDGSSSHLLKVDRYRRQLILHRGHQSTIYPHGVVIATR